VHDVFVVGLADRQRQELERALGDRYRFHGLLDFSDVRYVEQLDFDELLEHAAAELEAAPNVDGVMGYWDFPTTSLVPVLQQRFGLPGPSLEAVARCEHKFWSRRVQAEAVPDLVPAFAAFDPRVPDPLRGVEIEVPFWIKPVKAFASQLAVSVDDEDDLRWGLETIRENIDRFGEPFDQFLRRVDLPEEVAAVGGTWCLVEDELSGHQVTVEGYVHAGVVTIPGVVDSYRLADRPSFSHFQYPSKLDHAIKRRLADVTREVIGALGYDQAAFNAEYFVDEETGEFGLLEINPRISQSHAELFEFVDGTPNYEVAAALSVGRAPELRRGDGDHVCAAKFFIRAFEDAHVTRVPDEDEVAALEDELGGAHIEVLVREGLRLSEIREQDPYSCVLATIHVGGKDEEHLHDRAEVVRDRLRFSLDEVD
jgi:hypothetical protein